ncbi:MAG: hypothetical protein ACP5OH_03480 [Nitrososphaerota archaeon]
MGIKTYKDENGQTVAEGRPAGTYVFWIIGVLILIINIPITFANPIVGIILFIIMSLFFFMGRQYTKYKVLKKLKTVLEAEEKEKELEKQETEKLKTEEQQSQEQKEFEEFKKWKESRKNDNVS